MTEVRSGLRHALAAPAIYDFFQNLVGAYGWRRRVIQAFVAPTLPGGALVLDVGCGTAQILGYLPENIEYLGLDQNPRYLDAARARFAGRRANFLCEELTPQFRMEGRQAAVVLAFGILHHLDDSTCESLFRAAGSVLAPGGFVLTLDPLYADGQSSAARYIISRDRGTAVRTEAAYRALAAKAFASVDVHVDPDPIRIPYTGIVMKCAVPRQESDHG